MSELESSPFRFCPHCGVEGGEFLHAREFCCPVCGFRYFHNVATAAGIIAKRAGKYLFVVRAADPAKGKLGLPGGFVDPGERVEDALRREVREETGGEIGAPSFLASFPNLYGFDSVYYHTCDLYFTAELLTADEELRPHASEVERLVWLAPEEVNPDDLAFQSLKAAWALILLGLKERGEGSAQSSSAA
ncbi:ADP-ribose pyrophosphatase YjhB, NUDIX family [Formivibrio citricus]|uniref:ADP-ribose pyrophosphatase YjhB, NUDIX family n=1 Tax=Formivibrio citricus TaxID=83765 RepID=A0A1I4Y5U0_9NEIS|nr:NUDIX domain-containing protein [Formivibrio citricus]SFN33083.1 ADP-ribose pyrophosphatase YjhB, NUDIX family [Formivibrio citricus]